MAKLSLVCITYFEKVSALGSWRQTAPCYQSPCWIVLWLVIESGLS